HRLHDRPPRIRAARRGRGRLPGPRARDRAHGGPGFLRPPQVARGGGLSPRRVAMRLPIAASIAAFLLAASSAAAAEDFITVASTTSTEQSGLFKSLLPEAKKALGFDVHVVAVGTGQALDIARRGDADVVFV